jgi:REP-associated tyrosine transposase
MRPRRARRLPSFDYVGERTYFLTILTKQRRHVFSDANVALCRDQILRAASLTGFAICAMCLMPDHLHALVKGMRDTSDLRSFVTRAKQLSGYHVKRAHRISRWRPGYYDHVLRRCEDPRRYVEYIRANPVKARLVANPNEYPYMWIDDHL